MADRKAARHDAASPYESLRQAVLPAIVAYRIVSDEQHAAGMLAQNAEKLLGTTEDLLGKLGRVHLLTARASHAPSGATSAGPEQHLVQAYASVGMSWAKVISAATRLAELLLEEGDWANVGLLAGLVAESGEVQVAQHIRGGLHQAQKKHFEEQVVRISVHEAMTAPEIREAVAMMRELGGDPKERSAAIRDRRIPLIISVDKIASEKGPDTARIMAGDLADRVRTHLRHPNLWDHPSYALPEDRELFMRILTILELCGV